MASTVHEAACRPKQTVSRASSRLKRELIMKGIRTSHDNSANRITEQGRLALTNDSQMNTSHATENAETLDGLTILSTMNTSVAGWGTPSFDRSAIVRLGYYISQNRALAHDEYIAQTDERATHLVLDRICNRTRPSRMAWDNHQQQRSLQAREVRFECFMHHGHHELFAIVCTESNPRTALPKRVRERSTVLILDCRPTGRCNSNGTRASK